MVRPPLTRSTCPVVNDADGEPKKQTANTTSSGRDRRSCA